MRLKRLFHVSSSSLLFLASFTAHGQSTAAATPAVAGPVDPGPRAGAANASSSPVVVNVHNHYDKSIGVAAINSPEGAKAVLNVLRANPQPAR